MMGWRKAELTLVQFGKLKFVIKAIAKSNVPQAAAGILRQQLVNHIQLLRQLIMVEGGTGGIFETNSQCMGADAKVLRQFFQMEKTLTVGQKKLLKLCHQWVIGICLFTAFRQFCQQKGKKTAKAELFEGIGCTPVFFDDSPKET